MRTGATLKIAVKRAKWLLDDRKLKETRKIGGGAFGEVWLGILKTEVEEEGKKKPIDLEVAIKKVKESVVGDKDEDKFQLLQEAKKMFKYKDENVVNVLGVAADKPPIRIVMEFCPAGSLDEHLKKKRLPINIKLTYCLEAAKGMAYLASQKCIHRDLAARNCLIGRKGEIKISDFGLSKKASEYKLKNLQTAIAIRWAAPESLTQGVFSEASDVWSFGVLMWEIFSNATLPWHLCKTNNEVAIKVKGGDKMKSPDGTPSGVYDVMLRCWDMESTKRTSFRDLVKEISDQMMRT